MKCLDLFPLAQGPGDVKHEPLADRGDDPLAEQIIGDGSLQDVGTSFCSDDD